MAVQILKNIEVELKLIHYRLETTEAEGVPQRRILGET